MLALANGGTFDSATGGTFQSAADGTFHSDIPGTFESDMGGTFKVMQSFQTNITAHSINYAKTYWTLKMKNKTKNNGSYILL